MGHLVTGIFTSGGNDNITQGTNSASGPMTRGFQIRTGDGDDRVSLNSSATNYVDLGSGNDLFLGGSGSDYVTAGTGLKQLYGGLGNDVYYLQRNSNVTIQDSGGDDYVIMLNQSRSESTLSRQNVDLVISANDGSQQVRIQRFFLQETEIESIVFDDQTLFHIDVINSFGGYGNPDDASRMMVTGPVI